MPAINFPTSPVLHQIYTSNDRTFVWNGTSWVDDTYRSIRSLDISNALSEKAEISNSAPSGTLNFDAKNYSILRNTTNISSNWILNIRGNSTVSLNTLMEPNEITVVTHVVQVGSTSYLPTALQIDGVVVSVNWQGDATLSPHINCLVSYTYSIIKTASAVFTVFASQVKFT